MLQEEWFRDLKTDLRDIDPVAFSENRLTLYGKPFQLTKCGREYLYDIYRYIGCVAPTKNGKPVVIKKSRQVEATTMAVNMDMFFMASGNFKYLNVLHTFPQLSQTSRFSKDRIEPILEESIDGFLKNKRRSSTSPDTQTYKAFINYNTLYIEASSHDASRLRNISLDAAFFDEVQDTSPEAISAITPALSHAKIGPIGSGVQVYFGSPKNKGSYFEQLWLNSDQRHYYLGCINCHAFFLLYTPGSDEWEHIWIKENIIRCPNCGQHQNKAEAVGRGKWIPTKENQPLVGFFYNQFFLPDMTKEAILSQKPSVTGGLSSAKKWMNEVLGEFYEGLGAPITVHEIIASCVDYDRHMSTSLPNSQVSYMGIDWGSGEVDSGKSSTTITIITVDKDVAKIELVHKFDHGDWEKQRVFIDDVWRRFNVRQCIADAGYGHIQVPQLQRTYSDRLLGCWSVPNLKDPYKYEDDKKTISIFKDFIIEEMIEMFRRGRTRFPYADPAKVEWMLIHCSSMDMEVRTIQGLVRNIYVKGNDPNDGFMSLCYAWLAHKFVSTEGFKTLHLPSSVSGKKAMPKPVLAYVPRLKY
jgi:hypothetical protein